MFCSSVLPAVSSEIWKLYQNGKDKAGKSGLLLGRPGKRIISASGEAYERSCAIS
jgi:hypothetical protein